MINRYSIYNYYFFIFLIYIFCFKDFLEKYIISFNLFDEILALSVVPIVIFEILYKKKISINILNLKIFVALSIISFIGFYSIYIYKYQDYIYAFFDFLLIFKFFLLMVFSFKFFDFLFIEIYAKKIFNNIKIITLILFLLTILNYIFKIWPYEIRFSTIMSNKIFYTHPTVVTSVCIFLLCLLIFCVKDINIFNVYLIMLILIIISTFRFKSFSIVIFIIFSIIYLKKYKKRISIKFIIIITSIIILLSFNQIYYYFYEIENSARNQLLIKSLEIMKDFFPIGTGFGTYGSYFSVINYSDIYYDYNLSNIHGLSPYNAYFVSDNFWSMIIGQFGFLGIVLYIYIIILIFNNINYSINYSINVYLSRLIALSYLLISSTSESAFVNPILIPLSIILGIYVNKKNSGDYNGKTYRNYTSL